MTQAERILEYMQRHGSITPLEAMRDLGCYRLAARIHDLKAEGHDIRTSTVAVRTRYGTDTTVARYSLAPAVDLRCTPTVAAPPDNGGLLF